MFKRNYLFTFFEPFVGATWFPYKNVLSARQSGTTVQRHFPIQLRYYSSWVEPSVCLSNTAGHPKCLTACMSNKTVLRITAFIYTLNVLCLAYCHSVFVCTEL